MNNMASPLYATLRMVESCPKQLEYSLKLTAQGEKAPLDLRFAHEFQFTLWGSWCSWEPRSAGTQAAKAEDATDTYSIRDLFGFRGTIQAYREDSRQARIPPPTRTPASRTLLLQESSRKLNPACRCSQNALGNINAKCVSPAES